MSLVRWLPAIRTSYMLCSEQVAKVIASVNLYRCFVTMMKARHNDQLRLNAAKCVASLVEHVGKGIVIS